MPIEIFADYTADILGEEWTWEYIFPILDDAKNYIGDLGLGNGNHYDHLGYGYTEYNESGMYLACRLGHGYGNTSQAYGHGYNHKGGG